MAHLAALCKQYGRVCPKEWPEDLRAHGSDMRHWVLNFEEKPAEAIPEPKVQKKATPKKKSVKKDE